MKLRCAICNRKMMKAEFFIGGYPVGSTYAKNRGLTNSNRTIRKSRIVQNDQPDLFDGVNDDEEKSSNG